MIFRKGVRADARYKRRRVDSSCEAAVRRRGCKAGNRGVDSDAARMVSTCAAARPIAGGRTGEENVDAISGGMWKIEE